MSLEGTEGDVEKKKKKKEKKKNGKVQGQSQEFHFLQEMREGLGDRKQSMIDSSSCGRYSDQRGNWKSPISQSSSSARKALF